MLPSLCRELIALMIITSGKVGMFHRIRVSKTWLESPELRAARVVDGDVRHFLYDMCLPLDAELQSQNSAL
jgi:hypothetical protein